MRVILCLISLVLICAILIAGCTQSQNAPQVQITKTQKPTQIQSTQSAEMVPGTSGSGSGSEEYSSPPEEIAVSAQINEKDDIDKTITVLFRGGKGQNLVKSSWILFQRAGSQVERFELTPKVRSEVILQGSNGEDSIKVYASYYNGNTYKIAEKKVGNYQHI